MWGPDLTIRAPYITHTLKGGTGERAGQVRTHKHAHILVHSLQPQRTAKHANKVTCTTEKEVITICVHKADNMWLSFVREHQNNTTYLR